MRSKRNLRRSVTLIPLLSILILLFTGFFCLLTLYSLATFHVCILFSTFNIADAELVKDNSIQLQSTLLRRTEKQTRSFDENPLQRALVTRVLSKQIMPVFDGLKDEHVLQNDGLQENGSFLNEWMRNNKVFSEQIISVVDVQNELVTNAEDKFSTVKAQNVDTSPKMQGKSASRLKSVNVVKSNSSTHFTSIVKQVELDGPPENATLLERLLWLKVKWRSFKILHSDYLSAQFSKRMNAFLRGQPRLNPSEGAKRTYMHQNLRNLKKTDADSPHVGNKDEDEYFASIESLQGRSIDSNLGPCRVRFFMTWISSSDSFGPREHLSVESVFRSHPSACLVIISRTLDSQHGRRVLQPFVEKGFRVIAIAPDFSSLLQKTPALKWFEDLKKGKIDPGIISFGQNLSNLLRLAVLYRYGGIYIDSDVILLNDISHLSNAIGAQSVDKETGEWRRLNNAVMAFNRRHPLLLKFIQEFSLTFNGSKWGHNGPYLVSRVVNRVSSRPGYGCKVMPPINFYPVDWEHISSFFHASRNDSEQKWQLLKLERLQESSLAIHMWNKQSRHLAIEPTSIMDMIFQNVCIFCDSKILRAALQPQA